MDNNPPSTAQPGGTPEGALLRRARERLTPEPTRADVGKAIGRSPEWVGNAERGWSRRKGLPGKVFHPGPVLLARAAAFLGITPDELRDVGKDDAASELERLLAEGPRTATVTALPSPRHAAPDDAGEEPSVMDALHPAVTELAARIRGRAELAADQHPGESLKGAWVFGAGDDDRAAKWDTLAALGADLLPGGWTPGQIAEAVAVAIVLEGGHHYADPAAAGLTRGPHPPAG